MKTIQVQETTVDEISEIIADKLLTKIAHYLDSLQRNEDDVFLTRQETIEFLKINATTLWSWTNKGKVNAYGIGNRRYYNKKELIETLRKNQIES